MTVVISLSFLFWNRANMEEPVTIKFELVIIINI